MLDGDYQGVLTLPLTLVSGIASALAIVIIIAMCACKDKTTGKKPEDIELKKVNNEDSHKRKKSGNGHKKQTSGTTTIEIEAETADNRHSNGSVANGRPKSHDRALPAIPALSDGAKGVAATDDDEEELQDEGHYDVITRPKRPATGTEAKQAQLSKKLGTHPYETVTGDQDSDGTYAGIKEDNESAKLSYAGAGLGRNDAKSHSGVDIEQIDPTYSGIQEEQSPTKGLGKHPYAVVEGVGDAQYAHIDKKQSIRHSLIQQGHAAESMETLDGSYASVPPPPVPDKNFDAASENSELTSPPVGQMTSSPSLPPRNSIAAANGGGTVGNSLDSSQSSDGGGNIAASMAGTGNGSTTVGINGASVVIIGGPDAMGAASAADIAAAIKEARYSKVTARESLDNLKKRQAAEAKHMKKMAPVLEAVDLSRPDSTYASVTYDEIKSPGAAGGMLFPPDRESLSSDLYAEISSGQNSTRSSMYAQVGDVQTREFPDQAPAPPPLDLLKQLPQGAAKSRDNEEEVPDPGYSVIKRPRPQSVHSTTANQRQAAAPSGTRSPVYAVVDKKRNRQTVHMSLNVDKEINTPASAGVDNLYSEVNKASKVKPEAAGGKQTGIGARPKSRTAPPSGQGVTRQGVTGQGVTGQGVTVVAVNPSRPGNHRDLEPGYQTIGSVDGQQGEVLDAEDYDPCYDNIKTEPNYDQITDVADGGSEYDPNYESVTNLTASITGSASGARSPTEPGVAREIAPSSAAQGSVAQRWPPRREPIYQDIDEAKVSDSHVKTPNSKLVQGGTAL